MTLFRDSDPRFKGLKVKVAIFVALAVVFGGVLLVMQASQQGYFTTKSTLLFEAPTGGDLRSGMDVKLSGFKIGSVSSVELNENARVDVRIRIEDEYMKWIKADSRISVQREGLIGDGYLAITSGDPRLESLKEGDKVTYESAPGLADLAQDLRNRILPVIGGTTTMLEYFNDPKGDFRGSIHEMRALVSELRQTRHQIDALLATTNRVAGEDLRKTLATTNATLESVQKNVEVITARTDVSLSRLDEAVAAAKGTAEEAQKTSQSARKMIDEASPRVNGVLENADRAVNESRRLIDGASKRWLFRGGQIPDDDDEKTPMPAATAPAVAPESKKANP